ncbi:MAG: serine/threonine-protein kinase [Gemmatimonadales bacterium]|nr:serine/threonine-protein kinase [Gemmatimonadales bacterium]
MTSANPEVMLARLARAVESRYLIEKEAGRGSMARVYQAVELATNRPVAIKLLPPEAATTTNAERFLREISLTRTLDHPNILPLIDSGTDDGLYWYVMPFLAGETIREALAARGLMAVPDVLRLAAQVGAALSYAHAKGIIHRDLKPENIMIGDGRALVLDFGLARALDVQSNLTGTGMPLGTPAYMSPEQIVGAADAGAPADLYSMACVVYEMMAGRPPFVGSTVVHLLQGHLTLPPDPPSRHRRDVPPTVDAALLKALAKSPTDRQPSVDQFVAELTGAAAAAPALTPDPRPNPGLLARLFGKR